MNHFIEFCQQQNVLMFGDFTLKSGRKSKYFFNIGNIYSAAGLFELGCFYASLIVQSGFSFDVLFGPAYKGIPLATVTAVALHTQHQISCEVAFNRKEVKDHGEGGQLIGAPVNGKRVLIIDDVITAGTAIRQVGPLLEGATIAGVVIALDREEPGTSDALASREVATALGTTVKSIITASQLPL